MTSSEVPQDSTTSFTPPNIVNSSELAATERMLQNWIGRRNEAPTQPLQSKRARLLRKLSDLTSFQRRKG